MRRESVKTMARSWILSVVAGALSQVGAIEAADAERGAGGGVPLADSTAVIRLEDVTAGGDGSGNAPAENTGIDPRTGLFTTSYFSGRLFDSNDGSPTSVSGSPYIDSTFFLGPPGQTDALYSQTITGSGVTASLDARHATGSAWNFILKDRVGGVSDFGIVVGGHSQFSTSIGIHASMGITYNLDRLRERHGAAAVGCFSAFWGLDDCAIGSVETMAILSNEDGVIDTRSGTFGAGQGDFITLEIPPTARYLTLATGSIGNDNCDHGTIARPIVGPVPCPSYSVASFWSFWPSRVAPAGGETIVIEGDALGEALTVRVSGVDLLEQEALTSTRRIGVTPPLPAGIHDAEAFDFNLQLIASAPGAIEVAPPPIVTAIVPGRAFGDRPTPVEVRGQNFRGDMVLMVEEVGLDESNVPLIDQQLISDRLIVGSLPPLGQPEDLGEKTLLIIDQDRHREFSGLITYVSLGIERVVPSTVSIEGGTELTFVGNGFQTEFIPRLGGLPLTSFAVIDTGTIVGFSPALPAGPYAADLMNADGEVVAVLENAVEAVPLTADDSLPPCTQFETSLAEGTARFAWYNPVPYEKIIVTDAADGDGRGGGVLFELAGDTRFLEVEAFGAETVRLGFKGIVQDRAALTAKAVARFYRCVSPPPLTGDDIEGKIRLTLYGGNTPAPVARCAGDGRGGGFAGVDALRLGLFVQPANSIGRVFTIADRIGIGDRFGDPPGASNTNRLVTGFTLERDADKIEIAAFYNKIATDFGLSLRGRLIHVDPDDGFEDELTFPDVLIDRQDWKTAPNCVTYFRADKDVGVVAAEGEDPPARCPDSPPLPAGDYLLELYAVGGDPNLPYYEFQDDGRPNELFIKGSPCPPYPRVRVIDQTGLRTISIDDVVVRSATDIGLLGSRSIQTRFEAIGRVEENGVTRFFNEGEDLGLQFSWTFHHVKPPITRSSGGSSTHTEWLPDWGCFVVELQVLDETCGLSKKRGYEKAVKPSDVTCGADPNSFLSPTPNPSRYVAVAGLRGLSTGSFSGKRPFECRVLVAPCCGQAQCAAPRPQDLRFRLATPIAFPPIGTVYEDLGVQLEVLDLCPNQGSGAKFFLVRLDDLSAIPRVAAYELSPPTDPILTGQMSKDVYLQATTVNANGTPRHAFRNVGGAMRVFNRPKSLESSYWRGSFVEADQSYHFITKSSPSTVKNFAMPPSEPIALPLQGVLGIEIPAFDNNMNTGLTSAFANINGGPWFPEDAQGSTVGQVLGNRLDGAPLEVPGRAVAAGQGRGGAVSLPAYEWCRRLKILDNHFSQTLFESILYTGTIGPIPVTVWASVQLALGIVMEAQTNIKVHPFGALEGQPFVASDFFLTSNFELRIPCSIRADILFGIASIAARLIPEATASLRAHIGLKDLTPDSGLYFGAFISLYFEVEACLITFCYSPGKIKIIDRAKLIEHRLNNSEFDVESCDDSDGRGGELDLATTPVGGVGGGAPSLPAVYQSVSAPVTAASPDGLNTLDAWIEEDGSAGVYMNGDPTELPNGDVYVGSFVDPAGAFLANDRALIAWTKTFSTESGVDPRTPELTLAQQNLIQAQTEIVLSPIEATGFGWRVGESIRIADVPAEVPDIQDRRADGRPAIAADVTRGQALVAWVRYEAPDFFIEEPGESTRVYEPGTVNGGYGLEAVDRPTVRPQLEATAIYARKVGFAGPLAPAVRISPPGINIEPSIAFSPGGRVAYCVWVHDPTHRDLVGSNLGRYLLYSVYSSATGAWSEPASVVESPDDFPGLLEPTIALRDDGDGLLAFTALEKGSSERDTGLTGGSRFLYTCRLTDGLFGPPVRIHGKCGKRVYGNWVKIPVPQKQQFRVPGPLEIYTKEPDWMLVFQGSDKMGLPASRGEVMVTAIGQDVAEFAPPVSVSVGDAIRSNVVATIAGANLRTISLNGGSSRFAGLGAGGGLAAPRGFDVTEVPFEPDLAIASCTLSEQFPSPGTIVLATVEVENLGFASAPETLAGECVAGLKAIFRSADGSERVAAEYQLPQVAPGDRTTVMLEIEQPHDPVTLRVEIDPNPVDRDRTNDSSECFFGAPEPRDFACEAIAIESVALGQDVTTLAAQLSWRNVAVYDEICLYRDGQAFAALPGGCTAFVDREVSPGEHSYEIRARIGASRSCRVRVDCTVEPPPPPAPSFRRGDVNGSGEVDISDPITLLRHLFVEATALECPDAADSDDSGRVDITDAIGALSYLFLGSSTPAAPGPDVCGPDPTEDTLAPCAGECRE